MSKDPRRKGCPNPDCERHIDHVMLKPTEEYCPKCGTKLTFVCTKCFDKIEDKNWEHKLCERHEKEAQEKKEKREEQVQKVKDKAVDIAKDVVVPAAGAVVAKVKEDGIKKVYEDGKEVVKAAIKK